MLLHYNAPVHKGCIVTADVRECGFEEINHPAYRLDLVTLSDYFLFSNLLEKDLRGKHFSEDEALKAASDEHVLDMEEKYF